MNWEKSKAATPLKIDFLRTFFSLEKRFFLTGGSALGIFYLEHRMSYDLDLFSSSDFEWKDVDGTLRLACVEIGAELLPKQTSPTFRRYQIARNEETEIIDLVRDLSPQVDVDKECFDGIIVDTEHEIMINKICTLLSRAELKDIFDLYFLEEKGRKIEDYLGEAKLKDGGLDPAILSMLLANVKCESIPLYMIKRVDPEDLNKYINNLSLRMAQAAFPNGKK